ncbi:MAG TPA: cupin domain-containing protein [Solirubrobacteraceae bacterium]|nr:cupin domain-containing protein [Solirubrobacteraceae bacterium]
MASEPIVSSRGEGDAVWMLGGRYEVKVSGEQTNGAQTVMEMWMPAGMGPPLHTHPGTESVYVLEGKLRYRIGEETHDGGPGSFFHIPAGTVECFEPTEELRVLVTYTPGGIDRFFAEAGEPARSPGLPPAPEGPPDLERLTSIAARYGMDIQQPR